MVTHPSGPIESYARRGAVVRDRRRQLGLSQEAVAAAAEVSQEWVSKLERGIVREPGADALHRLATALRMDQAALLMTAELVPVNWTGRLTRASPSNGDLRTEIVSLVATLTDQDAALVAALAERLAAEY